MTHTHIVENRQKEQGFHTQVTAGREGYPPPHHMDGCASSLSPLSIPHHSALSLPVSGVPNPPLDPALAKHMEKGQMLSAVQSKEGVHKQHHRAMSQQCGSVSPLSVRNSQTSMWWERAAWLASFPLVYILRRRIIVLRTIHFYFLGIKKNVLLLHSGSIV